MRANERPAELFIGNAFYPYCRHADAALRPGRRSGPLYRFIDLFLQKRHCIRAAKKHANAAPNLLRPGTRWQSSARLPNGTGVGPQWAQCERTSPRGPHGRATGSHCSAGASGRAAQKDDWQMNAAIDAFDHQLEVARAARLRVDGVAGSRLETLVNCVIDLSSPKLA